jgi:hypothetical protein
MADQPSSILTPEQRGRLRAAINVTALEQLLAMLAKPSRASVILVCSENVTDAELQAAGLSAPRPLPAEPPADRIPVTLPDGSLGWQVSFRPAVQQTLVFKDPELQRLWELVQPPHGPRRLTSA